VCLSLSVDTSIQGSLWHLLSIFGISPNPADALSFSTSLGQSSSVEIIQTFFLRSARIHNTFWKDVNSTFSSLSPAFVCFNPSGTSRRMHLNHFIVESQAQPRVARFFSVHDTKTGKMYQLKTKCIEW
jgi:hypothetical protein